MSKTLLSLGVECFHPPLDIAGEEYVSSFCISSPGSVQVWSGTCLRLIQTFYFSGTLLEWGSLASHSYQHIRRNSSLLSQLKNLIMDVLVVPVFEGLQSLHITLWLLRDVCYADKGTLPQSARQWLGSLEYLQQKYTSSAGKNGLIGVLQRVFHTMPCLLLN